ncbi:hypothetical protein LIPSTDRAFT_291169 [Lipomyces starkeyi NRRL Y-11557]|uniref:Uncharacterized protein n=1 Tax=Lipomyces starkeyi NRRL Y-11557 TaxID=675824 RepID=A0A1E3Q6X0_LIPST|nr:hypothetical protein LIPSTDRAFT_291169 [Lipomyces starkeyi NRRL Y-11557]
MNVGVDNNCCLGYLIRSCLVLYFAHSHIFARLPYEYEYISYSWTPKVVYVLMK